MTTVIGRVAGEGLDSREGNPESWRRWHKRGCDFFGYAWGTPPDFRPHRICRDDLRTIRSAFRQVSD